jgi:hypothetical protein
MTKTFTPVSAEDTAKYGPSAYDTVMASSGHAPSGAKSPTNPDGNLGNVDAFMKKAANKFKKQPAK